MPHTGATQLLCACEEWVERNYNTEIFCAAGYGHMDIVHLYLQMTWTTPTVPWHIMELQTIYICAKHGVSATTIEPWFVPSMVAMLASFACVRIDKEYSLDGRIV